MEAVHEKRTFSLSGLRISPDPKSELQELSEMYPRAYDLRKSILHSVPFFLFGKIGVLYVIKQDDEEHYSKHHHVFYDGTIFISFYDQDVDLISNIGTFKVNYEGMRVRKCDCIYWRSESGVTKSIGYFDKDVPNQIETVSRLELTINGLYVFGKDKHKGNQVAFIARDVDGFNYESSVTPIPFPEWADMTSVQPGYDASTILFSDAHCIYALDHEQGSIHRIYMPEDASIRINEYRWKQDSFSNMPLFYLRPKESTAEHYIASRQQTVEIHHHIPESHIWLGKEFIIAEHFANNDVALKYMLLNGKHFKQPQQFLNIFVGPDSTIAIRPFDQKSCFFGISGTWYLLPLKKIRELCD